MFCECGAKHEVSAAHAGTMLACRCGREPPVPLLSELRKQAGHDPYATSARDRIAKLLAGGYVPPGEVCLACHVRTTETSQCTAICERTWVEQDRKINNKFLAAICFLILPCLTGIFLLMRPKIVQTETRGERGRDVIVKLPFRLCQNCREKRVLAKAGELRQALGRVPEYAELLKEYPEAELSSLSWVLP
jgi:hypothetical protein